MLPASRLFIVLITCLGLVAGCASKQVGPQYSYTPTASSAYIQGSFTPHGETLVSDAVFPITVDGDFVVLNKDLKRERFAQPVAMSPGKHAIGATFIGGDRKSSFGFNLDVISGERYTLKDKVVWLEGFWEKTADTVTVWIEDSKGNKVTDMQTLNLNSTATPTPSNSIIFLPKK